jgi:hypothetical protein
MPFCQGSDEGQRIEAKRLHRLTMQRNCRLTPEKALQELVKAYVANEPIGMYGPTAATRLRGTSVFYSNQQPPSSNEQPHQLPEPPPVVLTAAQIKQIVDYQASIKLDDHPGNNHHTDLTDKDKHHLALIREAKAKLPALDTIRDTEYFNAIDPLDKDEVVGEYCNKCKRWYRKGFGMHWTGKHKRDNDKTDTSTGPAPSPTTSTNVVQGSAPPLNDEQIQALAIQVAALHAGTPAPDPAPAPVPPQGTMFQLRGANYDTPVAPPGTTAAYHCQVIQPDTAVADDAAPMSGPSNFQPWGQVKGQGGQSF